MTALSTMETLGIPLELFWTFVVDASPVGISLHSITGQIIWANRKLCDIYGKPLSDLIGSDCEHEFHAETPQCPHQEVLVTGARVDLQSDVTVDGRILSLAVEPLRDDGGKTRGFVRLLSDITDARRAHEQMIKAERFATLGQVLFGIAHDVGTPLNIISGYSEFLLMRTSPEGPGYKELNAILNQTRRIATMFSDALELSRPSQGRKDAIEIKSLLLSALDLIGHALNRASVKAELTCRIEPPLIYGEARQLKQAFFNLLMNVGQLVGNGGRVEVVIDEGIDRQGFLGLAVFGTDSAGASQDFEHSLGYLLDDQLDAGTANIGLSLVKEILDDTGALIEFGQLCERGIPLMVYLPVKADNLAQSIK